MPKNNILIESGYASLNEATLYFETAGKEDTQIIPDMSLDCRMWDDPFLE